MSMIFVYLNRKWLRFSKLRITTNIDLNIHRAKSLCLTAILALGSNILTLIYVDNFSDLLKYYTCMYNVQTLLNYLYNHEHLQVLISVFVVTCLVYNRTSRNRWNVFTSPGVVILYMEGACLGPGLFENILHWRIYISGHQRSTNKWFLRLYFNFYFKKKGRSQL